MRSSSIHWRGEQAQMVALRDVTERKQAEQRLWELNQNLEQRVAERTDELRATNEELEAFAHSVSHDLRAPLRAIEGFSRALIEDHHQSLDDEARTYLERSVAAARKMGELIEALLGLSHAACKEMRCDRVDLSALAREIAATLQRAEPDRQVELALADEVMAWGDERLLRQVLVNLLENAWKFTARLPSGRIEFGRAALGGGGRLLRPG
ncbi:histidine kinase dimerization/phospho-acceptor domain-containing protein, partial [Planctomycetota bacterium]